MPRTIDPARLVLPESPPGLVGLSVASSGARDREIVRWIARLGGVTVDQVRERFRLGRTVAYRRVAALIEGGFLERIGLLGGQPALLRATRRGLRLASLRLAPARIAPDQVGHWIACADVALDLEREFGPDSVRSEREFRPIERELSQPIGSAVLEELPDGRQRLHRADLVAVSNQVAAIEVELTPKSPKRLEQIVRSWRRARWVGKVRYYATRGATMSAVAHAIAQTRAHERVELLAYEPRSRP